MLVSQQASTSVGAGIAACRPESITCNIGRLGDEWHGTAMPSGRVTLIEGDGQALVLACWLLLCTDAVGGAAIPIASNARAGLPPSHSPSHRFCGSHTRPLLCAASVATALLPLPVESGEQRFERRNP